MDSKFFDGIKIKHFDEVSINTNLRCNLNCVMCHQGEIKHKKDMSFELFKKILINLKKSGVKKIALIGGEIFVIKDMWKFIGLMEHMGFKYDLSSNLFYIPHVERLKELKGLERINTSLDGLSKTHNSIRRSSKAFENTVKNIKTLIEMGIPINSACVVQKANFSELESLTEFLCKLGVKSLSFLVPNKITSEEKEYAIKEVNQVSGGNSEFFVTTIKNPLGELGEEEIKLFKTKVENINKICKKYEAKAGFADQLLNPKLMFKNTSLKDYTCSLFNGYDSYVYDDGVLSTCPFTKLEGEKFKLSSNPALNILNSPEYLRIRKSFKILGAPEKCRYCCALVKKN